MPSTVRRAANKASPGVNEEGQYYRDPKLNPSPSKQPPKDLLSSLTPPRHNQAHGVNAFDGAGGRQSRKRAGSGRISAKHGNSKRRATNVCPGSAVSVSSSNANAAGTGPVEDEVCIIFVLFVYVNINASTHVEC